MFCLHHFRCWSCSFIVVLPPLHLGITHWWNDSSREASKRPKRLRDMMWVKEKRKMREKKTHWSREGSNEEGNARKSEREHSIIYPPSVSSLFSCFSDSREERNETTHFHSVFHSVSESPLKVYNKTNISRNKGMWEPTAEGNQRNHNKTPTTTTARTTRKRHGMEQHMGNSLRTVLFSEQQQNERAIKE